MAIGDRNKKGKPTDKVLHFVTNVKAGPVCKTKNWEGGTANKDEVTCRKCLKVITDK